MKRRRFNIAYAVIILLFVVAVQCGAAVGQGNTKKDTVLTAQEKYRFDQKSQVHCVVFSDDGKTLAAGNDEGTIVAWDVSKAKQLLRVENEKYRVSRLFFHPDNEKLVATLSSTGSGSCRMWELNTGRQVFSNRNMQLSGFLSGGKEYLFYSDKMINICSTKDMSAVRQFQITNRPIGLNNVTLSKDGSIVAHGHDLEKNIKIWRVATGEEVQTLKGYTKRLHALCISASGKLVCGASADKMIRIWEVKDGRLVHTVEFKDVPLSVAFSPDEKWLAVGVSGKDIDISIMNVATGKEVLTLKRAEGPPWALVFSPKGDLLACANGRTVQVWELSSK